MYKVKIYEDLLQKGYFWYLKRSLLVLADRETIALKVIGKAPFVDRHRAIIYVNGFPLLIDIVDSSKLPPIEYFSKFNDFRILKANLSIENRPDNWNPKIVDKIKPYIIGRTMGMYYEVDELKMYHSFKISKYKVISYSGAGVYKTPTENRLKVYDLFEKVFKEKALLIFRDRPHFKSEEKNKFLKFNDYLKKYRKPTNMPNISGLKDYFNFLADGEFSINFAGVSKSNPFRCVDSILVNKCVISTKIYVDIWKDFPCVMLPICGYDGTGDWDKAREILQNLDKINQDELKRKARNWYDKYLSPEGMWKNQILKALEC